MRSRKSLITGLAGLAIVLVVALVGPNAGDSGVWMDANDSDKDLFGGK